MQEALRLQYEEELRRAQEKEERARQENERIKREAQEKREAAQRALEQREAEDARKDTAPPQRRQPSPQVQAGPAHTAGRRGSIDTRDVSGDSYSQMPTAASNAYNRPRSPPIPTLRHGTAPSASGQAAAVPRPTVTTATSVVQPDSQQRAPLPPSTAGVSAQAMARTAPAVTLPTMVAQPLVGSASAHAPSATTQEVMQQLAQLRQRLAQEQQKADSQLARGQAQIDQLKAHVQRRTSLKGPADVFERIRQQTLQKAGGERVSNSAATDAKDYAKEPTNSSSGDNLKTGAENTVPPSTEAALNAFHNLKYGKPTAGDNRARQEFMQVRQRRAPL